MYFYDFVIIPLSLKKYESLNEKKTKDN